MNRDEYRQRNESNQITQDADSYYPVDKQSGGTWFGFNQSGTVMALLNRYQENNPQANTSRGAIIPTLLACNNEQINTSLTQMNLSKFNPFNLIIVIQQTILNYSWNGQRLKQQIIKDYIPFFISSSSVDASNILNYRQQEFEIFTQTQTSITPKGILTGLHLNQQKDTSSSIFMSREATHTKSISQVIIEDELLVYNYIDEQNITEVDVKEPYLKCRNIQIQIK